jgi:hypothetical protein
MRFLLTLLLVTSAFAPVHADDMVPLDLRFARINLANGRILENAALTGFNRDSDLIYVMEDRKLRPYPAALFPGFVTEQISVSLAEYPDTSNRDAAPPAPPAQPPVRENTERDPIGSPEDNAGREAAIEDAVTAKAQTAALRHFRFNQRTGSGYTTMTNGEVDLDRPSPVRGWPHRYRVEGIVYFSFYDSVGETFQNRRRGVEVIVEAPSPRDVEVLEVNTDWTPQR